MGSEWPIYEPERGYLAVTANVKQAMLDTNSALFYILGLI